MTDASTRGTWSCTLDGLSTSSIQCGLPPRNLPLDSCTNASEAARSRLTVGLVDGRYYWTSRENRLLQKSSSGEFTYLSSDPGHYIRFTRLNDKISYAEHVDLPSGSVTWWGESSIVVGR